MFFSTENLTLKAFLQDLFKDKKTNSNNYENDTEVITCSPLQIQKNGKKFDDREQIFSFFTEDLMGFSKEPRSETTRLQISTFKNFKFGNRDNTIGRRIFKKFREDPNYVIKVIDEKTAAFPARRSCRFYSCTL